MYGYDNAGLHIQDGHTLTVLNNMTIRDGQFSRGNIVLNGDLYLENLDSNDRAEGGFGIINFNDSGTHNIYAQDGAQAPSLVLSNSSTVSVDGATTMLRLTSIDIATGSTFNAHSGDLRMGIDVHDAGNLYNAYDSADYMAVAGSRGLINRGSFNSNNTNLFLVPGQRGEGTTPLFIVDSSSDINVLNLKVAAFSNYGASNRGLVRLQNSTSINVNGNFTFSDGRVDEDVAGTNNIRVTGDVLFSNTDADVYAYSFQSNLYFTGSTDQSFEIQSGTFNSILVRESKAAGNLNLNSNISLANASADFIGDGGTINLQGFNLTIPDEFNLNPASVVNQSGGTLSYGSWNGSGTINP
jgi:hypothetical protein